MMNFVLDCLVWRRRHRPVSPCFCVQLLCLAVLCQLSSAIVPLALFGISAGDYQLTQGVDDQSFGPYSLPYPIPFPDGSAETSYYVSSNGLISFSSVRSYTLSPTYVASQGRLITAAYGDLYTPDAGADGGMYHRTVAGGTSQLRPLWSDVLPNISFSPTYALVFTVDRCPRLGSPSQLITAQTIILWNNLRMLILFRVRVVAANNLLFGGYVGPMWTWVYKGDSTLWPTMSNVNVPGLFVAVPLTPSKEFSSTLSVPVVSLSKSATELLTCTQSISASLSPGLSSSITRSQTSNGTQSRNTATKTSSSTAATSLTETSTCSTAPSSSITGTFTLSTLPSSSVTQSLSYSRTSTLSTSYTSSFSTDSSLSETSTLSRTPSLSFFMTTSSRLSASLTETSTFLRTLSLSFSTTTSAAISSSVESHTISNTRTTTLSLSVTAFTSASHRTQSLTQWSRASISDTMSRSAVTSATTTLEITEPSPSISQTLTLSATRRSGSMTPSLYCALRRDAAGGAAGVLHDMKSKMISSVVALMPTNSTTLPVAGASTEWIWAKQISRSDLLEGLPLAMNFSIYAPASEWKVHQVELFIGSNGADDTRIGDAAEFIMIDNNITVLQQGTQQLLLLVSPPNSRWLPASTSTFVSTNIMLRVTLQCSQGKEAFDRVTVVFNAPGETRPFAEEVKTTSAVAQWSSTFSGIAAGGAVGRVAAVRSIVLCADGVSGSQGPLGRVVNAPDGCTASQIQSEYRGTILGNLLLLCCAAVALALATALYSRATLKSIRLSIEDLGMPSPMYPVLVVVTPSSVSATFSLLKAGTECAIDTIIAMVGVVLSLLPLTLVVFGVCMLCRHGVVQENTHRSRMDPSNGFFRSLRRKVAVLFEHRYRWRDGPSSNARLRWSRIMTVVALEYSIPWYAAVDVGVLTLAGAIGALSTIGSVALCKGSGIALLLLYAAQLVLCLILRPMATIFGSVIALTTLSLTITGTGLQVYYLFRSKDENVDLNSFGWVLTLSGVCDLLVLGVSLPKSFGDVMECGGALKRHVETLKSVLWPPPLDLSSTLPEQELFTVETTSELIEDITLDFMDNSSMFDALFWSADGLALIQPDQQKEESAFVFKDISANSSTSSAPDTTAPLDAITLHTVTVRNDLHGLREATQARTK